MKYYTGNFTEEKYILFWQSCCIWQKGFNYHPSLYKLNSLKVLIEIRLQGSLKNLVILTSKVAFTTENNIAIISLHQFRNTMSDLLSIKGIWFFLIFFIPKVITLLKEYYPMEFYDNNLNKNHFTNPWDNFKFLCNAPVYCRVVQ